MKFWPLNCYYKRFNWKIWLAERFLKLYHRSFKIKNTCCWSLQKWSKIELCLPPIILSKIFDRSIYGIATWNSWEKIKLVIPCEQNYVAWLVKNSKTVSSKLMWKISLSVYFFVQASRQASTRPLVFLSQIFLYFPAF